MTNRDILNLSYEMLDVGVPLETIAALRSLVSDGMFGITTYTSKQFKAAVNELVEYMK